MRTTIILDVDGVLLDFDHAFDKMMMERFGIDFDGSYIDFCESVYFSKLEPYKKSEFFVKKLYQMGYTLRIITACGDSDKIKEMRIKNLFDVFGDIFESIDFVGMQDSKEEYLKQFVGRDDIIYVEDTVERYELALRMGIPSVMMRTDDTKHVTTDIFDDWSILFKFLTGE